MRFVEPLTKKLINTSRVNDTKKEVATPNQPGGGTIYGKATRLPFHGGIGWSVGY